MAHHRQAEGATKGAVHVNKSRPIHLKHPGDPTHPENSAWHSMAITRTACWRDNHRLRVTSDPSIVTCLNCLEWTHARLQKIETANNEISPGRFSMTEIKAVHNAIKELPVGSKARKDLRHVERLINWRKNPHGSYADCGAVILYFDEEDSQRSRNQSASGSGKSRARTARTVGCVR